LPARGASAPADKLPVPPGVPLRWQHPLVEQLSREGYNILAELDATLDAQAYREACQVISTSLEREGVGLLPDHKDPRLWTSLPLAIESTMQEHPVLRQTMQDDFSTLGEFRVRQGIAAGDSAAVGTAALQFYGTDAAADAHRWLGDRSLAEGRLAEAAEHYREALASASDERRGEIAARLRLAGALEGRDVGSPVKGPIQIGEHRFTADQFEQMVRQLREKHTSPLLAAEEPEEAGARAAEKAFPPASYDARPWAHLDGRRVKRPNAVSDRGFDWPGRQIAVLVTDRYMLVNNQIDQAAYDLRTGRQVWAQRRAVHEQFQQWPLERMRPVLVGDRVVVRQLGDEGPELVSLEAATGRLVWTSKPDGHVASDPLVLADALVALTVSYDPGDKLTLWLARFDLDSGDVVSQAPLAEFRDLWQHRLPCQATVADGRIVVTAGGCVLCCDAAGQVSWLREQIWIPPPGDAQYQAPQWFDQVHEPPLVENNRVFALQPGVWALECLDVANGHLAWRRTLAEATRLVRLMPGRLVVQTTDGLLALDPDSGRALWHYEREQGPETRMLCVGLCAPPGEVLACYRERESESNERRRFVFVWIDSETGEPGEQTVLNTPAPTEKERPDPWLGPLVAREGRQWAFFGPIEDPASRDVLELVPAATPANNAQ
jgi:outer membrane protein assembly factor BamB